MNKNKKPMTDRVISWRSMLISVPNKNIAANILQNNDGTMSIIVKKNKPKFYIWPLKLFFNPKYQSNLKLDKIGKQVWQNIDGKKNIEEIIDIFAQNYQLSFHEARASVTQYIKMLVLKGAVVIIQKSADFEIIKSGEL